MTEREKNGISCEGLDQAFQEDEVHKSNLILEAHYLVASQQPDTAAQKLAQAAEIEERLSDICLKKGLQEKSFVHRFSAVCCWAQAGNYYDAIRLGDELLTCSGLSEGLRQQVQEYTYALRVRRTEGAARMATSEVEG